MFDSDTTVNPWHDKNFAKYNQENSFGETTTYNENSFAGAYSDFQYSSGNVGKEHYYNLENKQKPKNYYCDVCSKPFFTHFQYEKHVSEHIECPFPECGLKAHLKIIDQHISHQHMLIDFTSLQIDDETWIAERKKRFPTLQMAEVRRAEQIERLKRGERLGKNNKKFQYRTNEKNFNKRNRIQNVKLSDIKNKNLSMKDVKNNATHHSGVIKNKFNHTSKTTTGEIESDSDLDSKFGIPAFKGTKEFYESTGEVSLFGIKSEFNSNASQSNLDISDEEEWDSSAVKTNTNKCMLQNALGSLMGTYESDTESGPDEKPIERDFNKKNINDNPFKSDVDHKSDVRQNISDSNNPTCSSTSLVRKRKHRLDKKDHFQNKYKKERVHKRFKSKRCRVTL